jgi:predicted lipid-binding transport protein (Tim44 family)
MTSSIIFAIIAFFLAAKLFSILGQKRHFDRSDFASNGECNAPTAPAKSEIKEVEVSLEKITDPMARLKALCPSFNQKKFLQDSKNLYVSILRFYANGDTHSLSELINIEMMRKFANKIAQMEERGMKCKISMIKVKDVILENISFVHDTIANLRIVFDSEVIHYTSDAQDNVKSGHKTRIDRRKDIWTFSRDIRYSTSNWKLVEVSNLF